MYTFIYIAQEKSHSDESVDSMHSFVFTAVALNNRLFIIITDGFFS